MKAWLIVLIIIAALIAASFVRSFYELYHLEVSRYKLKSAKLPAGRSLRMVFLSDLHGRTYGPGNKKLLRLTEEQKPDMILIGGDMMNSSSADKDDTGLKCVTDMAAIAPTYYALGNHEGLIQFLGGYGQEIDEKKLGRYYSNRLRKYGESEFTRRWKKITETAESCGAVLLDNKQAETCSDINVTVSGLTLPVICLKKKNPIPVTAEIIEGCIGKIDQNRYNIILAHSPEFFECYAQTGADLILSGHLHGGIMRLPFLGGVISPKLKLFPKYSFGEHVIDDTTLIVTKGCGTHHVNIRLFNKPEIAVIDIEGTHSDK